jgi:hypothetical protein
MRDKLAPQATPQHKLQFTLISDCWDSTTPRL